MTLSRIQDRITQLNPTWTISMATQESATGTRLVVHAARVEGVSWQRYACPYPTTPQEFEALAQLIQSNLQ